MRSTAARLLIACAAVALVACGQGQTLQRSTVSAGQALTGSPELLELESPGARQDLFREIARSSLTQAARAAKGPVLFPIFVNGEMVAAPGIDPRADLLQAPADATLSVLVDRAEWSDERRDSLQGLSEQEAAELVARSLLSTWGLRSEHPIAVERLSGAPYAAGYVDGILRLNPSFLYLSAAASGPGDAGGTP